MPTLVNPPTSYVDLWGIWEQQIEGESKEYWDIHSDEHLPISHHHIAIRAYYLYIERGRGTHGFDQQDWCAAKRELQGEFRACIAWNFEDADASIADNVSESQFDPSMMNESDGDDGFRMASNRAGCFESDHYMSAFESDGEIEKVRKNGWTSENKDNMRG